ncbi:hypothetical protein AB0E63_43390 [Kribbella sp. NPDC026596]|uniref:COG4315 family predicted lipoprotein n=1 Tax=Kribbella sp. NPDC026596 TaxID=3155122 RepID=UPI0033C658CE
MRTIVVLIACGLVLSGCGADSGAGSPPAAATPSVTVPSAPRPSPSAGSASPSSQSTSPTVIGTGIKTDRSDFGVMLFDSAGQAIYLFDKEKSATSACYGACAEAWPPVLTKAAPKALGEVKQALLGTTRRTDGTNQVTYGGHPLYFYAHESKNEVKCHNVAGFGGLWLVVTAAGKAAPA